MLSPIRNFAEGNGNIFHVSNTTPTNTPSTGAPLPVKFSISLPLPDPPTGHDGHIRRPRNAFFLFRSDFKLENDRRDEQDRIKSQAVLSRMAGELWGTLDDKAKHIYKLRAEKEAHQHIKTYPGYRYNPLPRKAPARTEYNGLKRRKPVRKEVCLAIDAWLISVSHLKSNI